MTGSFFWSVSLPSFIQGLTLRFGAVIPREAGGHTGELLGDKVISGIAKARGVSTPR